MKDFELVRIRSKKKPSFTWAQLDDLFGAVTQALCSAERELESGVYLYANPSMKLTPARVRQLKDEIKRLNALRAML